MNERIIKLGLESGMLNYVDLETPRHYFLCGHADEECLNKFAELIVEDCLFKIRVEAAQYLSPDWRDSLVNNIKEHFGVKE